MGFQSIDNWLQKASEGRIFRADWTKITGATAFTAGRCYALGPANTAIITGYPESVIWGECVRNPDTASSSDYWILGSDWIWGGYQQLEHTFGTSGSSTYQQAGVVAGVTYRTVYTVGGVAGLGGRIKIGGTPGLTRTTAATFTENIVAGGSGLVEFEAFNNAWFRVGGVSVIAEKSFQPYNDTFAGSIRHGGNVSPQTKHLTFASVLPTIATLTPGVFILVDVLGVYARIDHNSAAVQALANAATLPRYSDGKGVCAFLSPTADLSATAQSIAAMSYTNTTPASGRLLAGYPTLIPSSHIGLIPHSGLLPGSGGPFLPLATGDAGVKSVESIQFSVAAGGTGLSALVLCKPLLSLPVTILPMVCERETLSQLPSLPRIYDGAYLTWLFFAGSAVAALSTVHGHLDFCWG